MRLLPRRRPKIEKLKQAGDADGLRAALDGGLPHERAEAAAALGSLDGPAAEEGVSQALADPEPSVREAALGAVAGREAPIAVDALLDAAATWPYPEEYAALERALAVLVEHAREGRAEAFARRLLDPAAPPLDERHQDALAALLAADPRGDAAPERVADELVAQLGGAAGPASEARAEQVLGWLGPPAAEAALRSLDGDGVGRGTVRLAGLLGDSRAVDPLVGLLGAPDPDMRSAAATALGNVNDTRAVQALIGATQDPDHAVRDSASEALNAMGVAAVIVGVASVMREAVREQLGGAAEGGAAGSQELAAASENSPPPADDLIAAHPPTWAQEVMGRLLKRMGGQ